MASWIPKGYDAKLVEQMYNSLRTVSGYKKERYAKNREAEIERSRIYRKEHPDKVRKLSAAYIKKNKDKITQDQKQSNINLPDCRIKASLARFINKENITPELIELTRLKIKLKREIKNQTKKP